MTWFKVDDKSAFHSKVVAAGNEAWGALCRAGAWSSGESTDGMIPDQIALMIAPKRVWDRLETCGGEGRAGLVSRVDCGWQIHDFTFWNPPAALVKSLQSARHERAQKAAFARWERAAGSNAQSNATSIPSSNAQSNANSNASGNAPSSCLSNASPPRARDPVPTRPDPSILPSEVREHRGPAEPSAPPATKRKKPCVAIPAEWRPVDRNYRRGQGRGFDRGRVDQEAELFRLKAEAKGWVYSDWTAAFDNWLVSEYTPNERNTSPANSAQQEPSPRELADKRAQRTSRELADRGRGALGSRQQAEQARAMLAAIGNGGTHG